MRKSEEGNLLYAHAESVTVPAILDGDTADVACTADANFIRTAAQTPIVAMFAGEPQANLGIVGAWVSNASTGVITVRFSALTGGVAGGAQTIVCQQMPATT